MNGKMHASLYNHELDEMLDDLKRSLAEDKDELIFAVTENNDHVAMVLIEPSGSVYVNEIARDRLKKLWGKAYNHNIKKLMPHFLEELINQRIPVQGVKFLE